MLQVFKGSNDEPMDVEKRTEGSQKVRKLGSKNALRM
jgi:hypothetical protein